MEDQCAPCGDGLEVKAEAILLWRWAGRDRGVTGARSGDHVTTRAWLGDDTFGGALRRFMRPKHSSNPAYQA